MNQPLFNAGNKNLIKILTYLNFVVFDTSLLEIFKYCFFLESWRILFFKCLHNLNQHKPHTVYNKVFMVVDIDYNFTTNQISAKTLYFT